MAKVMTAAALVAKAVDIATNYKTLYVMGCFGAPMTDTNKTRYCKNHDYNKQTARTAMIQAASADTFGFDCVCLIKGILWGWSGDKSKVYGGAQYASNGVQDASADGMIALCSGVTTNFAGIVPGAAVWVKGHIGIYIGDGLAVECTPAWKNQVQITAVGNIGSKSGYNTRKWTKWGLLPYVDYSTASATQQTTPKEGDEMDQEKFNEMFKTALAAHRKTLQDNDSGSWSQEARDWAASTGLVVGSGKIADGTPNYMWEDFLTREQMAMLLYRFAQMMGKA